jgi:hypothetical protein
MTPEAPTVPHNGAVAVDDHMVAEKLDRKALQA